MRRLAIGAALAPTAVLCAAGAFRVFAQVVSGGRALPFLAGFLLYPLLHAWRPSPTRLYVLGHELAHALAAVLTGSRVRGMEVGSQGGHVVLSKTNPFIALAPYLIPLYAVLWLATVRLVGLWRPLPPWLIAAGLGLTLSFHFLLTVDALWRTHQTDLDHAGGTFFSVAWILLVNSFVLVVVLKGLEPPSVSVRAFLAWVGNGTAAFWVQVGDLAWKAAVWSTGRALEWKAGE